MEKGTIKGILGWILYFAAIIAVSLFIVVFIGQRTVVDGDSMNDTLHNNDNLLVDKVSYRFHDIERFDIVVFRYYGDYSSKKKFYIKRVIGLPGETVQIIGDDIYINGEILDESYGKEEMLSSGRAYEPITLGEDEYFVLGDNRNNSSDSRDPSVANVNRSQIVGRAFFRITPLADFGPLKK